MKTRSLIGHAPILLLFALMLIISQFVYMYGDDYKYSTYLGLYGKFRGQEATLTNIIQTQIYDYMHANGRFITNVASILLLLPGIELWRALNPILITLLAYAMFAVVYVRLPKQEDVWRTSLMVALLLLLHPYISRQTLFFAIGSMNYVVPMLGLLILIAYFRLWDVGQPAPHKTAIFFVALIGLLTGWSQEQVSLLAVGFMVIWFAKRLMEKKTVNRGKLVIFGSTLIGALGLFLAPGPKQRAMTPALDFFNELSLIDKVVYTFPEVMRFFIVQQPIYTLLVLLCSILLCISKDRRCWPLLLLPIPLLGTWMVMFTKEEIEMIQTWTESDFWMSLYGGIVICSILIMNGYLARKERNYLFVALTLGYLLVNLVMLFTPSFTGGRVAFPAVPLAISLILLLTRHWNKKWQWMLCVPLGVLAIWNYLTILNGYMENAKIHEERLRLVQEYKHHPTDRIELPPLKYRLYAATELDEKISILNAFKNHYKIPDQVEVVIKRGKTK